MGGPLWGCAAIPIEMRAVGCSHMAACHEGLQEGPQTLPALTTGEFLALTEEERRKYMLSQGHLAWIAAMQGAVIMPECNCDSFWLRTTSICQSRFLHPTRNPRKV